MPGAEWFPGARLNYAEHMLGRDEDAGSVAVVARSQSRGPSEVTFGELREQVARARAGLRRLGVGPGDRVVAYLPNIPETLVAFLATASLGAVWATCPPEFGARSVLHRLGQLEPKVLLAVAGYRWGDRYVDRREQVAAVREELPSLEAVVHVPYGGGPGDSLPGTLGWDELLAELSPLEFEPVPFDHPLYVLFSSGTTGLPKAIVHGHGGILLEHSKNHALSWDIRPGDRLQWFTTTAWMMWNALASTLLLRASVVMIEGNPAWPDLGFQWRLAEETKPTMLGLSPAFVLACRKEGIRPSALDLTSIRSIGAAGSPLPVEGYEWLYRELGPDVFVNLGSGGTDVCTGIVQGYPLLPVYAGEMSGRCLESTRPRSRPPASRSSASWASSSSASRCRRCRCASGTTPATSGTAPPTSTSSPVSALRRLDHVHRARQLDHHGPLRRDPQPGRGSARDERALLGDRGDRRRARQPGRPPREVGRAAPLRRAARRGRARRRARGADQGRASQPPSPRATRRTRSSPSPPSRVRSRARSSSSP